MLIFTGKEKTMTDKRYMEYKQLFEEIVAYSSQKFKNQDLLFGEIVVYGLKLSNKINRAEREKRVLKNKVALQKEARMLLMVAYVMKLFQLPTADLLNAKLLTEENIQLFCEEQERIYLKYSSEQNKDENDL